MAEPALKEVWDSLDDIDREKARRAIRMLRDDFADASIAAPKRWHRLAKFYAQLTTVLERMDARDASREAAK